MAADVMSNAYPPDPGPRLVPRQSLARGEDQTVKDNILYL
jgi:hypothetical protein